MSSLDENLSKTLLSVFHDHEQKLVTSQATGSQAVQTNQMRMGKRSSRRPPACELHVRVRRIGANELDRGSAVGRLVFGQEDRTVTRSAQEPAQRELPVDDLVFPLLPELGHQRCKSLSKTSEMRAEIRVAFLERLDLHAQDVAPKAPARFEQAVVLLLEAIGLVLQEALDGI